MNAIKNCDELAQVLNDLFRFDVCQKSVLHDDMHVIMKDNEWDVALIFTYKSANDKLFVECNYGDDELSFDCFSQHVSKCGEFYVSDADLDVFLDDAVELWNDGFSY